MIYHHRPTWSWQIGIFVFLYKSYLVHFSFQLLCYNHNLNQNESNACHSTFFSEIMFLLWAIASDLHVAGEIELSMMLIKINLSLHVAVFLF